MWKKIPALVFCGLFVQNIAVFAADRIPVVNLVDIERAREFPLTPGLISSFRFEFGNAGNTGNALEDLLAKDVPPTEIGDVSELPDRPYFDFSTYIPEGYVGRFILELEIDSPRATEIALLGDGRQINQVRLNGVALRVHRSDRWIEKYGYAVKLPVRAGINHLALTVVGSRGHCSAAMTLADIVVGRTRAVENGIALPLARYIYQKGETLVPEENSLCEGTTLAEDQASVERSGLHPLVDEGLYSVVAHAGESIVIESKIAVVTDASVMERIGALERKLREAGEPQRLADFSILRDRLAFVLPKEKRRSERSLGDRDLVGLLSELYRLEKWTERATHEDWLGTPGLHFGTFESATAKASIPYLVYLPSGYDGKKEFPLVSVVPAASKYRGNFVENYFLDFKDLVDCYVREAEMHQMIVLWCYCRNEDHTPRMEHFMREGVEAVTSRFRINPQCRFIIGACGPGRDAFAFIARNPGIFSSGAMHQISFQTDQESVSPDPKLRGETAPMALAAKIRGASLFLSHGELDLHVPVQNTISLSQELERRGVPTETRIIRGADEGYFPGGNNQWIAEAFWYFANQATLIESASQRH